MPKIVLLVTLDVDSIYDYEDAHGNEVEWEPTPDELDAARSFASGIVTDVLNAAFDIGALRSDRHEVCVVDFDVQSAGDGGDAHA